MLIDGKKIAGILEKELAKEFRLLKNKGKKIKLVVILVGDSPEQLSFVKIKKKLAEKLKIQFELKHIKEIPLFQKMVCLIKETSMDPKTTGIIVQQPLPSQLQTDSIFEFIDLHKEIEGHRRKTTFIPPIGLAVLTIIKFIYANQKYNKDLLVNFNKDLGFFKRILKNKKIVLLGRGLTGGKPINHTLSLAKINYIGLHSQTPNPEEYLSQADIVISAVGKNVIRPETLKPGTILINVGLRHENSRLKGDYDEKDIKDIASFYTPTPGGIGPIDVLYLYKNLLDAAKSQK
jgi:methylenetetrahydrofolate dehydrogenase (NADP+) / methenyltetrahydrofolate cyclohydrolase